MSGTNGLWCRLYANAFAQSLAPAKRLLHRLRKLSAPSPAIQQAAAGPFALKETICPVCQTESDVQKTKQLCFRKLARTAPHTPRTRCSGQVGGIHLHAGQQNTPHSGVVIPNSHPQRDLPSLTYSTVAWSGLP